MFSKPFINNAKHVKLNKYQLLGRKLHPGRVLSQMVGSRGDFRKSSKITLTCAFLRHINYKFKYKEFQT